MQSRRLFASLYIIAHSCIYGVGVWAVGECFAVDIP